jgi:lia operon protein LiaG
MKTQTKTVLTSIGILLLAVAGEIVAITHMGKSEPKVSEKYHANSNTQTVFFQSDRISEVNTDLSSCNLKVSVWDESKLELTIESNRKQSDRPYAQLEGNTVFIKEDFSERRDFSIDKTSIDIKIPRYLTAANARFSIILNTTSGAVKIQGVRCTSFSAATISGRIILDNSQFSSGLKLNSTSGDIICTDIQADSAKADCISGNIDFTGSCKKIEAETVSGYIHFSPNTMPGEECSFSSTSGSINLELPENKGYSLDYEVLQGRLADSFTNTKTKGRGTETYKDGTTAIKITTTSGNINVSRRN